MTLTSPPTRLQQSASPAIASPSNTADPDPGFPDISIEDVIAWATSLPLEHFKHLLRSLISEWTHHNTGGKAADLNRVLHELIAELTGSSPTPPSTDAEGWAIIPGDVPGSRTAIQVGSLRQYEATKVRKPRESKKGKGKAAKAPKVTTYQYTEYSFCWQERDEHGRWRSFSCYVGGCPVGQKPKGAASQKIATIERQRANRRPYGETLTLIGKENRINSLKQGNRPF